MTPTNNGQHFCLCMCVTCHRLMSVDLPGWANHTCQPHTQGTTHTKDCYNGQIEKRTTPHSGVIFKITISFRFTSTTGAYNLYPCTHRTDHKSWPRPQVLVYIYIYSLHNKSRESDILCVI